MKWKNTYIPATNAWKPSLLIEDAEIDLASKLVAENFTASVIQAISKEKVKPINKKDRKIEESKADKRASKYDKNTFNYQLIYYVAVASVTIFLSLGAFIPA